MKSPGIPSTVPVVKAIYEAGIDVVSEIEFASWFTSATLVGITGSNGKTTTASLTYALLKSSLNVGLSGNIGDSFAKQLLEHDCKNYVLEISSFQLDDIKSFKPHIAVITNITPDHLDRYDYDFEKYIAAKFAICKNQTATDYLIYDADDSIITSRLEQYNIKATCIPFSLKKTFKEGVYLNDNSIEININNKKINMPLTSLKLEGKHNEKCYGCHNSSASS